MTYVLTYEQKPWTANQQRQMHYREQAKHVKEWRSAFFWLAKQQQIPAVPQVSVTVRHECKSRLCDVGAVMPAAKASIDGLVDAGIVPDDTPQYVRSLTFEAPEKTGRDALTLIVEALQ